MSDDRDLAHARALILECTQGECGLELSDKGIGFATHHCDSLCGWDCGDGRGRCGKPIARICVIWTPDILHTVVFCAHHGDVMHAAQQEFRRAAPMD